MSLLINNGLNPLLLFMRCRIQLLWGMERLVKRKFLYWLRCLASFRCDMFEPAQVMFFATYFDFDCFAEQFLNVICLNLSKLRSFQLFSSRLCCLAIFWYDMCEPVRVMFTYDSIWSRYVWFLLCFRSKKLLINQLLISSSAGHVYRFVYLL